MQEKDPPGSTLQPMSAGNIPKDHGLAHSRNCSRVQDKPTAGTHLGPCSQPNAAMTLCLRRLTNNKRKQRSAKLYNVSKFGKGGDAQQHQFVVSILNWLPSKMLVRIAQA